MKWWQSVGDTLGLSNYGAMEDAKDAMTKNKKLADDTLAANQKLLDQMLGAANTTYGAGANSYADALKAFQNSPTYQANQYSYKNGVNDFLDPARNMRVQGAMNAIQNSRANAGGMFSSDTMNEMSNKAQTMSSEEWEKAYQRMMQDKGMDLNQWQVNNNELKEQYKSELERSKDILNLANADRNAMFNANQNYYNNLVNMNNANMQTLAGINNAKANIGMQGQGLEQGLFKLGTSLLTSLF